LRHRADRYPIEHATLQFHLGATLLDGDRPVPAAAALRVSARLFEAQGHEIERAKALNLLGAALLHVAETEEAIRALTLAAQAFEAHEQPLELGAARFNLGLVLRRRGEHEPAADRFAEALDGFTRAQAPHQASAAARELGSVQLELADASTATTSLEHALELAQEIGDRRQVGAAANLLGLARLATDEPRAAVDALRLAASAAPRQLDPASHAMATANLALAHERVGDLSRARLAAWRAASVAGADPPVIAQATELLGRLGRPDDDLHAVLDREPPQTWASELAPHLTALLDVDPGERERMLDRWVDGQLAEGRDGIGLGAALLEVLLELPPRELEILVRSLLSTLTRRTEADAAGFRSQLSRAMVRFHQPQWQRLTVVFERLADEVGGPGGWA
jgi:tetratricopeptide (TPR) repeat protein